MIPPGQQTESPWQLRDDHILLHCHVQPGARQTRLVGLHDGCVKIQLQAPPVDGKANKALIAWLAKRFGIPKSAIEITRGASSRRKSLRIESRSMPPEFEQLLERD
jgi:uncharacterized protein (TIGR00251 family)